MSRSPNDTGCVVASMTCSSSDDSDFCGAGDRGRTAPPLQRRASPGFSASAGIANVLPYCLTPRTLPAATKRCTCLTCTPHFAAASVAVIYSMSALDRRAKPTKDSANRGGHIIFGRHQQLFLFCRQYKKPCNFLRAESGILKRLNGHP